MIPKKHKNKPSTLGFFIKRLVDSGYRVEKIFNNYSDADPRMWTIVIDPGNASILCTCFINKAAINDNYFEFWDGGQFFPNMKIKTQSVEVLISYLAKYNIDNKNASYNKIGLNPEKNNSNSQSVK